MKSKMTSNKGGHHRSCEHCRNIRRKCALSTFNSSTCVNCQEARIECSLASSRMTPSTDAKRKIEEIWDTSDRLPFRTNQESLSTSTLHNSDDVPTLAPAKKRRQNKPAQTATRSRITPKNGRQDIPSGACGICLKAQISSGEKKGDRVMFQCDIKTCLRWYHLSCMQFTEKASQMFLSFGTGIENSLLYCLECYNPKSVDLVNAIAQAEADFKMAIERIQEAIPVQKQARPKLLDPSSPQEQDNSHRFNDNTLFLGSESAPTTDFEPASEDKFQGFEEGVVKTLLGYIEDAIFTYDREISYANNLFLDKNDLLQSTPLKVWDKIDSGHHFLMGKQWFEVDGTANNLSESHAPITAAIRQMLKTPDNKPLQFSYELEDLNFSQIHTALINWFVLDLLNNELNIYNFPTMKPLRATQSAVANFGDARWKGNGKDVLREVQLRAWHKTHFRDEVDKNVGWQGDLLRRFEAFLAPLTKKLGKIDPCSKSRAEIIQNTIALWSYLDAAQGTLKIIHPHAGEDFDRSVCEHAVEPQTLEAENMKVKWVTRRGFRFRELRKDGNAMLTKALVIAE